MSEQETEIKGGVRPSLFAIISFFITCLSAAVFTITGIYLEPTVL